MEEAQFYYDSGKGKGKTEWNLLSLTPECGTDSIEGAFLGLLCNLFCNILIICEH